MASSRWVGVFVGLGAVVLGNVFALTLPLRTRLVIYKTQALLLLESVVLLGCFLIWRKVAVALENARPSVRKTLKLCLVVYLATANCAVLYSTGGEPHWFSVLSFVCFGVYAQLIAGIVLLKGLSLVSRGFCSLGLAKFRSDRSDKLGRASVLVLFVYAVTVGLYGVHRAWQPPQVTRVNITLPGLPRSLDSLRILLLCDVHLGPSVGRSAVETIADISNQLQPDVTVLVGDLADGTVRDLGAAAQPLQRLTSPMGKFFVTGNHEYFTLDVDAWFSHMRALGFSVLHNSAVRVRGASGRGVCFAGVDDWDAERLSFGVHVMDVAAALSGCDPADPVVLLAHQPRAAKFALDSGHDVQLVLSGHTHGGQFFPASLLIYLTNPFFRGLYSYRDAQVYVSSGAVYWGIPVRLGSQAELNLITLLVPED